MLRPKRSCRIVTGRRLDADNAAAGRERARGDAASRQQASAATRNEQIIERPSFFEQFAGRRTLTSNDVGMIVRRDYREAAFGGEPAPDCFAVAAVAIVE